MLQKKTWQKHNLDWSQIPDQPYRILIIGDSGSGKTNLFFNLINHQSDIDKIYLYAKDPYEAKYQLLINTRESTALKHFNNRKVFIEYSNDINPGKRQQILIVFDDMIADMLNTK